MVKELEQRHGWDPVLWTGVGTAIVSRKPNEDYVRGLFPDIVFRDIREVLQLHSPATERLPLDGFELRQIGAEASEALYMMVRQDPEQKLTIVDAWRIYQEYLAFWNYWLDKLKPAIVVHPEIPHFTADLALYQLARLRGLKTAFGYFTKFRRGLLWTKDPYDKASFPLSQMQLDRPVHPLAQQYAERLAAETYWIPPRETIYVARSEAYSYPTWFWAGVKRTLILLVRGMWRNDVYDQGICAHRYLSPQKPFTSALLHWLRIVKGGFRNLQNRALYDRLAVKPALDEPYVYFAASYQPERTTSPDAGLFVDPLQLLRLVRQLVPAHVRILYKEHPRNFDPRSRGYLMRGPEFFQALTLLPGVELVAMEKNSFELIDRSICCITATGSVALETVFRKKQAIIWGAPWFEGLDGVFRVSRREEFQAAWAKIQSGYQNNAERNLGFLSTLIELEGHYHHAFGENDVQREKNEHRERYQTGVVSMAQTLSSFVSRS